MEPLPIVNNEHRHRFETRIGDEYAYMDYRWYQGDIALMHTFVPESARGQGVSGRLAEFVLRFVREQGLRMLVYCPYVAKYLKEHPEYADLVRKR